MPSAVTQKLPEQAAYDIEFSDIGTGARKVTRIAGKVKARKDVTR